MATNRYVFPGVIPGDGSYDGPKYTTIGAAITDASGGDTIIVAAGTYAENVVVTKELIINGAQKDIASHISGTVRSGAESIVTGHPTNGGNCFTIRANNVSINGFKCVLPAQTAVIRDAFNVQAPLSETAGVTVTRSNITIKNNIIISNAISGQRQSLVLGEGPDSSKTSMAGRVELSNLTFTYNYINFSSVTNASARGIIFNNFYAQCTNTNVEISNNYIKHSTSTSTALGSLYGFAPTRPIYYNSLKIQNNTITAPNAVGISGIFDMDTNSIISENIITATGGISVNFREENGSIINNTITLANNNGFGIRISNGQFSNVLRPAKAIITGNIINNAYGLRYITISDKTNYSISDITSNTFSTGRAIAEGPSAPITQNGTATTATATSLTMYARITDAINAANTGTAVEVSAGTFNENVLVNKSLTLKGAGESTIIQGTIASHSVAIQGASNVTLENFKVRPTANPDLSGNFMLHVYSSPQAENITLHGLIFDGSVAGMPTIRGVSLNHAKNVLIEDCDLPATQNYSLGVGGVDGLVVKNSTLRASGWGTVGIFPSDAQPTASVKSIDLSQGNTFVNGTGVGPATSGIIQIQPTAAVPITYGFSGAVNVILPAAFVNAYMIDLMPGLTWSTLTNNREVMRTAAVISALRANSSLASIYASNLLTAETLYEDASYNLVLAASKAIVTENKIINFGAESAIPATKSSQYAIKFGEQIRVYDLSSAAVPRSLYPSQVVYLMPDSVSAGVPVLPKDVTAIPVNEYYIELPIESAQGVRALQWFVSHPNDLSFLGVAGISAQGVIDTQSVSSTSLDITNLVQLNGANNVSAILVNQGGTIVGNISGLESTQAAPVSIINQLINVPPTGEIVEINVENQNPIKIVEPSSAAVTLSVLDTYNTSASITIPPGAGQVAVQVLSPGEFSISRKVDNIPENDISITFEGLTYIIDDNGRIRTTVGNEVVFLENTVVNGRFTIQQPLLRVPLFQVPVQPN